jgi:Holliday junction resolvasome RuvABC endonuclease subunit
MRVLALDAATGITGYAIYDDKKLVDYGTFSTDELMDSTSRINEVKHWLLDMINHTKPDAIGIENI